MTGSANPDVRDGERSIRELIATWHRATAAGDLARLLPLMAEDVVFLTPGQPPMRGRDAFAAGFREALQHYCIDFEAAHLPLDDGDRSRMGELEAAILRVIADVTHTMAAVQGNGRLSSNGVYPTIEGLTRFQTSPGPI